MTVKSIPRWVETLIGAILGILSIPILVPLFAWLYADDWWDRHVGPRDDQWQRWYAWWPVALGYDLEPEKVWLEPVERIRFSYGVVYRRPGDEEGVSSPWIARGME